MVIAAVAAVAAVMSTIIAALAKRDSSTSAKAARRSADASEVSARAAVDSAAEERRANDRNDARDRAARNAEIQKALSITEWDGHRFQLINRGDRSLRDVEFVDPPEILADLPQHFALQAVVGESQFFTLTDRKVKRPRHLQIRWEGQDEPVPIEFPYDVMKSIG